MGNEFPAVQDRLKEQSVLRIVLIEV